MSESEAQARGNTAAAEARFEEGRRLLAGGDPDAAIRCFAALMHEHPSYAPVYLISARLALEAGDSRLCVATLENGLAKAGENADLRFRLALVHQREGRLKAAHDQYAKIVEHAPGHAGAWLKLGICKGEMGEAEESAMAVQRAVLLKPELREAADDETLPAAMRAELKVAKRLLRERYAQMVASSVAAAREGFPDADLHRLEEAFEFLQGKQRRLSHPDQRPGFLLFPDMPARPWYERGEFDWVEKVEAATPMILEELAGISAARGEGADGFAPYLHGVSKTRSKTTYTGEDFSVLADSMDWNAFHLMKAGPIDENIARCPGTAALMRSLPLAQARDYMPEVFFSVLRPGAHIVPHYGQMNIRLTVHLGLTIPQDCGIRVHEETRGWEPGRVLVFDDSFKHEAWNHSDQERVVLIFEVWNPDLSEAEIFGIQHFLELRGEWMARFGDAATAANGHAT